jgi:hypothetical protein
MSLEQTPSYFAIIPAHVRYCKEIEPAAKLLYGEITALANAKGYCWASNAYFASVYEVDERTIQRWLHSLSEQSFIIVDLEKEGLKTNRKIWISSEVREIFTTRQKCRGRDDKTVTVDTTKMPPNKDIIKDEKKTTTETAAVFSCLIPLGMPQSEKEWITKAYSEPVVAAAVKVVTHPEFNRKETLQQAVKWFCKNPSEPPKSPEETAAANKAIAKAVEATATVPKGVRFEVLSKQVVIGHSGGNYVDSVIEYSTNGFKEQIESALRKHNIKW